MQGRDLGEIVGGYRYVREVYSAGRENKDECLLSSDELFSKLLTIYDRVGVEALDENEIGVRIKLPENPNPIFRDWWHDTKIRRIEEPTVVVRVDSLAGYIEGEAVLGTKPWMREFETMPGDKVVISPNVPVPEISYRFR